MKKVDPCARSDVILFGSRSLPPNTWDKWLSCCLYSTTASQSTACMLQYNSSATGHASYSARAKFLHKQASFLDHILLIRSSNHASVRSVEYVKASSTHLQSSQEQWAHTWSSVGTFLIQIGYFESHISISEFLSI